VIQNYNLVHQSFFGIGNLDYILAGQNIFYKNQTLQENHQPYQIFQV